MTSDAEDRSTWPRNGQVIRRDELLRLIEENGGPEGLDLRGAMFPGDGPDDQPWKNPIDLSPEALAPLVESYQQASGGSRPPWLWRRGGINLRGAYLQGVGLHGAHLQRAGLDGAHLQEAYLELAHLKRASLEDAELQGAHLDAAHLEEAYLWHAQAQGALFGVASLERAVLSEAHLQDADLMGARLQEAYSWNTQLQGANLQLAQLQGTRMYDVASLDGAHCYGAFLDHTRVKRESLGEAIGDELQAHRAKSAEHCHRASEAYLLLKNNFNQIGRYEDASWAYVKEQQMEKMAYHWEWRQHGWRLWRRYSSDPTDGEWQGRRAWGSFWRWLRNWAYEMATGYGERPWNPVIGGGVIVLAFGSMFCATRAVANFWDALIYSLATFATFNLADTGPTGRGADVASSVEALLGISVLALVVFTLGNRMSRG